MEGNDFGKTRCRWKGVANASGEWAEATMTTFILAFIGILQAIIVRHEKQVTEWWAYIVIIIYINVITTQSKSCFSKYIYLIICQLAWFISAASNYLRLCVADIFRACTITLHYLYHNFIKSVLSLFNCVFNNIRFSDLNVPHCQWLSQQRLSSRFRREE